ncbi:MAG: cobalamin B12-binding domain-containing protein [Thermoguttaceae bacterium]
MANSREQLLASLLQNSAGALAGYATGELLEVDPSASGAFGDSSFSIWQNWLKGLVEQMGAAVSVGEPERLAWDLQWGKAVLSARGVSPAHLRAALECLRHVLLAELPGQVHELAEVYLGPTIDDFDASAPPPESRLSADTPGGRLASSYLLAVLEGDRRRARDVVLDGGKLGLTIPQIYLGVILPAQEEIGRMWVADEITVAEEHFATATTRTILAQLLAQAPIRPSIGKSVMTAAVSGNRHDIGIQMVCDFFEMDGWKAIQLGAEVPTGDLVAAIDGFRVDLLALSATQSRHLPVLREAIAAVRQLPIPAVPKILVGGRAFLCGADTARKIGADGLAAGPVEAVRLADSMFGLDHDPKLFAGC